MTPPERLRAIAYALGFVAEMLADAETHELPGSTLDGLTRARARVTAMRGWLEIQSESAGLASLTNVTDKRQLNDEARHQKPPVVAAVAPLVSPSARPLSSLPLLEGGSKNAREGAFFTAPNVRQERKFDANKRSEQTVAQSSRATDSPMEKS